MSESTGLVVVDLGWYDRGVDKLACILRSNLAHGSGFARFDKFDDFDSLEEVFSELPSFSGISIDLFFPS